MIESESEMGKEKDITGFKLYTGRCIKGKVVQMIEVSDRKIGVQDNEDWTDMPGLVDELRGWHGGPWNAARVYG